MPYCVVADLLTEWFFFESVPFFLRKGIPMPRFRSVLAVCTASAVIGGMVACSAASAADGKKPSILPIEYNCLETSLVETRV